MGPLFSLRSVHISYGSGCGNWLAAVVLGFALWITLVGFVLKPLAIRFARGCETVGEYVKTAVAFNFGKAPKAPVGGMKEN
jgi:hypothetical protein